MNKILKLTLGTAFALVSMSSANASGGAHTINANTDFTDGITISKQGTVYIETEGRMHIAHTDDNSAILGRITGSEGAEIDVAFGAKIDVESGGLEKSAQNLERLSATAQATLTGHSTASVITWSSFISSNVKLNYDPEGTDTYVPLTKDAAATVLIIKGTSHVDLNREILSNVHNVSGNAILLEQNACEGDEDNLVDVLLDVGGVYSGGMVHIDRGFMETPPAPGENLEVKASLVASGAGPMLKMMAMPDSTTVFSGNNSLFEPTVEIDMGEVKFQGSKSIFPNQYMFGPMASLTLAPLAPGESYEFTGYTRTTVDENQMATKIFDIGGGMDSTMRINGDTRFTNRVIF